MKLKEDNIDIYNNSALILNNKTPSFIQSWIFTLVILTLLFIIISFIPFNMYSTYNGYIVIEDNKSYINLLFNESDFPINKNNILYIKDNRYKYKILNVENNNVRLSINLNDSLKIKHNIITINILKDRTTIFNIIMNKIKKGFGL